MAALGVTPWNDGAGVGPWKRLAPAQQAQQNTSLRNTMAGTVPGSSPATTGALDFGAPIQDAFATMRNDSAWSRGNITPPRQPASVTSGLPGAQDQNATYYNYKAKGFNDSLSSFLGRYNMTTLLQQQAQAAAERAAQQQQQGGYAPGGDTGMGNGGGQYANVDRWNNDILNAQQRVAREFGVTVPGNVIKAVMMLESQGQMVGCNQWGYCGLMQTGSGSNVSNFNAGYNNTVEGNLYYGVQELANWYRAVGTGNWVDAAAAYFSGYNYDNPSVSDGFGTTVAQYRATITKYLQVFANGNAAPGQGPASSGGARSTLQAMFPSGNPGYDFGVTSSNGLYDYGTSYGLNGVQHTGMDIPAPLGSTFFAPGNATVVCVGCWRNDHITNGVGRIELEMPDGAHILYDHTNKSFVQVGQQVHAGQALGTNGGMYSPHTHLEVRVPDRTTSSGWRLVDPAAYFAGYVGGGGYAAPGSGGYTPAQPANAYQRALFQLYGRWW